MIRWLKRSSARHIRTAAKRIRQAERMEQMTTKPTKMTNHFDEKQAIQSLKDEMDEIMRTGGKPRQEYQLTEAEKRIADAGLAHLREMMGK
jgi:hypothetical protein